MKVKGLSAMWAIWAAVVMGASANAALISESQDFENLSIASIDGQGAWKVGTSSNSSATVANGVGEAFAGSNGLKVTDGSTSGSPFVYFGGTPSTTGAVSWVAKVTANTAMYLQFSMTDMASYPGINPSTQASINRIGFGSDGTFDFTPSGSDLVSVAYEVNTWYQFIVTYDVTAGVRGKVSVVIKNATTGATLYESSSAVDMQNNVAILNEPIRTIVIRGSNTGTGTMYVDDLVTVPEPAAAGFAAGGAMLLFTSRFGKKRLYGLS